MYVHHVVVYMYIPSFNVCGTVTEHVCVCVRACWCVCKLVHTCVCVDIYVRKYHVHVHGGVSVFAKEPYVSAKEPT